MRGHVPSFQFHHYVVLADLAIASWPYVTTCVIVAFHLRTISSHLPMSQYLFHVLTSLIYSLDGLAWRAILSMYWEMCLA